MDWTQTRSMKFATLIREMGRDKAIIFSTHILEEVEAACTRAIIIDRGKIVANGTPNELKARAPLAGTILIGLKGITWRAIETRARRSSLSWKVRVDLGI